MNASEAVVLAVISIIIICGLSKRADVYGAFTAGAEDGLKTAVKILPQLLGLMVAVKCLGASGAMDFIVNITEPIANALHFPSELVPFALLRPVSGSGSLAMATEISKRFGADSFLGRAVAVMMGSTETTFYTISVYFGAAGVSNVRHSLVCALLADFASAFLSVAVCRLFF